MSNVQRGRLRVEIPGKPDLYQLARLPGWETVGSVTDAGGTGALVRNVVTGKYCRANAGALASLPQRKVEAALAAQHGGGHENQDVSND